MEPYTYLYGLWVMLQLISCRNITKVWTMCEQWTKGNFFEGRKKETKLSFCLFAFFVFLQPKWLIAMQDHICWFLLRTEYKMRRLELDFFPKRANYNPSKILQYYLQEKYCKLPRWIKMLRFSLSRIRGAILECLPIFPFTKWVFKA